MTGSRVAIGLAQIGEFSFIVAELADRHGLSRLRPSISWSPRPGLDHPQPDPLSAGIARVTSRSRRWSGCSPAVRAPRRQGTQACRAAARVPFRPLDRGGPRPVGRQVDQIPMGRGRHTRHGHATRTWIIGCGLSAPGIAAGDLRLRRHARRDPRAGRAGPAAFYRHQHHTSHGQREHRSRCLCRPAS